MDDRDTPAPTEPRKKADVWAVEREAEPWELAAARLIEAWTPAHLLTQAEFDAALLRIRELRFG